MGVTRPCTGAWCTTSYQRYPTALSLACKSIIGTLDAGPDGHCEREDHQPLALFYSDLNSSLMVQVQGLAFGYLPAQAPLDAQKPDLMTGRAHVLFAQLCAVLGPAPSELGEHLGTRP
jgi:hypothetical protein